MKDGKEPMVIEEETTDMITMENDVDVLALLGEHSATIPYDPGFMVIKPNKGAKSFNAGSIGTMDGPLDCIIISVNIRRGLWPPERVSDEDLATAFGILAADVPKYSQLEVQEWTGGMPLCGSSGNGGNKGAIPKVVDADAPDVVANFVQPAAECGFNCTKCEWNQYESSFTGGRGKACKETHMLLMYFPDIEMAATLSLPPTSIKPWREYKTSLPKQNFSACWSSISTTSIKKGGNEWNVMEFTPLKKSGKIAPVTPQDVASLGVKVSYSGQTVPKLTALLSEFLNIELAEDNEFEEGSPNPAMDLRGVDDAESNAPADF